MLEKEDYPVVSLWRPNLVQSDLFGWQAVYELTMKVVSQDHMNQMLEQMIARLNPECEIEVIHHKLQLRITETRQAPTETVDCDPKTRVIGCQFVLHLNLPTESDL